MAFAQSEVSLMGYTGAAGGNHFYFYANIAGDTLTTEGFFDPMAADVADGDLLFDVSGGVFYQLTEADGVVTVDAVTTNPA